MLCFDSLAKNNKTFTENVSYFYLLLYVIKYLATLKLVYIVQHKYYLHKWGLVYITKVSEQSPKVLLFPTQKHSFR